MNHTFEILIKTFRSLRGLITFLFLAGIIIGTWKFIHLDDWLVLHTGGMFGMLINVEIHIAQFIIKNILGYQSVLTGNDVFMPNNVSLRMNPGCTGFKQYIQLIFILLLYPGPFRKKSWYIPVSLFILFMASILHFVFLAVLFNGFPAQFLFFHDYLSRWMYFGIFFLIWLCWEEVIIKKETNALKVKYKQK